MADAQKTAGLQRLQKITDKTHATKLYAKGLHSSFQIAAIPQQQFITQYGDLFESPERAEEVYKAAKNIRNHLTLYYGSQVGVTSPHRSHHLPSYEDLFGDLDFCDWEHCQTIFSPAAYLADLMRFKEQHLIDDKVTKGYKLQERRPDLLPLELSCENTNTAIPKLEIVNEVLEEKIGKDKGAVYTHLAKNYRFNLPLEQIRTYLHLLKTDLGILWRTLQSPNSPQTILAAALETLNLTKADVAYFGKKETKAQLAQKLGWTDNELDCALEATNATTLKEDILPILAQLKTWQETYKQSIAALCTVFGELNQTPLENTPSFFAQVFQQTDMQKQLPLPNSKVKWNVNATPDKATDTDRTAQALLMGALGISAADLQRVANAALHAFGIKNGQLPLGIQQLSALYRLSQIPQWIELPIADALQIIAWIDEERGEDSPSLLNALAGKPTMVATEALNQLATTYDWMQQAQLSTDALACILNKNILPTSPFYLSPDSTLNFLNSLYAAVQPTLLTAEALHKNPALQVKDANGHPVPIDYFKELQTRQFDGKKLMDEHGIMTHLSKQEVLQKWIFDILLTAFPSTSLKHQPALLLSFDGKIKNEVTSNDDNLVPHVENSFVDGRVAGRKAVFFSPDVQESSTTIASYNALQLKDPENYTITAWIKLEEQDKGGNILDNIVTNGGSHDQFLTITPERKIVFYENDKEQLSTTKPLQAGQWYHIAVSYSNKELIMYIDGKVEAKGANTGNWKAEELVIDIGYKFHGTLEEIAVYNKILSAEQINDTIGISFFSDKARFLVPALHKLLTHHGQLQNEALNEQLASYFDVPPATMTLIRQWDLLAHQGQAAATDLLLQVLLKPSLERQGELTPAYGLPQEIITVLRRINRLACLAKSFQLNHIELQRFLDQPDFMQDPASITVSDVHQVFQFKQLVNTYQDQHNGFVRYLAVANGMITQLDLMALLGLDTQKDIQQSTAIWKQLQEKGYVDAQGNIQYPFKALAAKEFQLKDLPTRTQKKIFDLLQSRCLADADEKLTMLSDLTAWPAEQIKQLNQHLNQGRNLPAHTTIAGLAQRKACFDLSQQLGMDIAGLLQLNTLQGKTDYKAFELSAQTLLEAIKSKYSDTQWTKVYEPIRKALNEKKRDVLAQAAIEALKKQYIDIPNLRALSEQLLIDVEVTGIVQTSRIKEAIGCLQWYINRCFMHHEPEITFPDKAAAQQYWEWMDHYRVWEANRKTFLYPENYIQPELRKERTQLFDELVQTLQQSHVDKDTVSLAVNKYLDRFAEVANLKYAGSYAHHTPDPTDTEHPQKTLYILGKTHTQPPHFYYRTGQFNYNALQGGYRVTDWTPWTKIELTINAQFPSPIYAFDKLFVFWVEVKPAPAAAALAAAAATAPPETYSNEGNAGQAKDKRFEATINYSFYNFSKSWAAPQTLGEPILLPEDVSTPEEARDIKWQHIYLTYDPGEKIVVKYREASFKLDTNLRSVSSSAPLLETLQPQDVKEKKKTTPENDQFTTVSLDGSDSTGYIVAFDGKNDYISLSPDYTDFSNKGLTITAWVYYNEYNNWSRIWDAAAGSGPTDYILLTNQGDTPNLAFNFGSKYSNQTSVVFENALSLKEWIHIAITLDPDSKHVTFYKNGQKVGEEKVNELPKTLERPLNYIGKSNFSHDEYFNGKIADWRLYDHPLTQQKIQDIYIYYRPQQAPTKSLPELTLPKDSANYKVTNEPNWSILDTGRSEYLFAEKACIRLNSTSIHALSQNLFARGVDGLYNLSAQYTPEDSFQALEPKKDIIKPWPTETLDFGGANGLYYWELFFHVPFLVANRLNTEQQFQEARKWYQYIYNPTIEDNLQLYLPLYEEAQIASQGASHGAIKSEEAKDFPLGTRKVLTFDGKDDYIEMPYRAAFNTETFTFSCWVKIKAIDKDMVLMSTRSREKRDDNYDYGGFIISVTREFGKGNHKWLIFLGAVGNVWGPEVTAADVGKWQHVAFSHDGERTNVYINGKQVASKSNFGRREFKINKTAPLYIGAGGTEAYAKQPVVFFNGQIANVCLWNEAISVKQLKDSTKLNPNDKYWRFVGLRASNNATLRHELKATESHQELLEELTDNNQVAKYYEDPFDPHAIAQLRPIAYQKSIVMHYVDNLLDWGDSLYRQNTRETLVEATMLYLAAYDLLGQKPDDLGPCKQTVDSKPLKDIVNHEQYFSDHIPESLLKKEEEWDEKKYNSTLDAKDIPNNYIPGTYFGVPENEQFAQYWDRVQSRLHNIRYNLTIDGKPNYLPLFQPPIDPAQLAAAVASGAGVSQALASTQAPVPHYRFVTVVEKAKAAISTVVQFGNALLSALEKKDSEHMVRLQHTHEQALLSMSKQLKEDQVKISQSTIDALQQGLLGAQHRCDHYRKLRNVGLSVPEQTHFTLQAEAVGLQVDAQLIKGIAIGGYFAPTVFGFATGDFQPGEAISQGASIAEGVANILNQTSGMMATTAQFQRRAEDWQLQQTMAQDDINHLQHQITGAQLQVQLAQHDLAVLEKNVSQQQEVNEFLQSKFTDKELYQWLLGKLSALYFQTYQLAYTLTLAAERAWQFERGHTQTFIQPGHWNALHKGLLAGEALMLDTLRMEKAYMDQDERRFEIEKTISLAHLDPQALLDLKNKGTCTFDLAEKDFAHDYPGHYLRQIKSISISFPALVGPYQNVHATLTQTSNKLLRTADAEGIQYLLGKSTAQPESLQVDVRANQQIALSQGLNDSGLFELNFNDARYLPFEGTGAISSWQLDMPRAHNPINFDTLTDVVIRMQYTALPGDATFRQAVLDNLGDYHGKALLPIAQEFASAWHSFIHSNGTMPLAFTIQPAYLRPNLQSYQITGIALQWVLTSDGEQVTQMPTLTLSPAKGGKPTELKCNKDPQTGTVLAAQQLKTPIDLSQAPGWTLEVKKGTGALITDANVTNLIVWLDYAAKLS